MERQRVSYLGLARHTPKERKLQYPNYSLNFQSELGLGRRLESLVVGDEVAGSKGGRSALLKAIESLKLSVPTAELMHRNDICNAIDHIGVPKNCR